MGIKACEAFKLKLDELKEYLHKHHSIYMDVDGSSYYLTDVNFQAWRAQDTTQLNEKGHYTDCSDLVPSVDEFMVVTMPGGATLSELVDGAEFYASCPKDTVEDCDTH